MLSIQRHLQPINLSGDLKKKKTQKDENTPVGRREIPVSLRDAARLTYTMDAEKAAFSQAGSALPWYLISKN